MCTFRYDKFSQYVPKFCHNRSGFVDCISKNLLVCILSVHSVVHTDYYNEDTGSSNNCTRSTSVIWQLHRISAGSLETTHRFDGRSEVITVTAQCTACSNCKAAPGRKTVPSSMLTDVTLTLTIHPGNTR